MPLTHRTGDLFKSTDLRAVGHGCNACGKMGAGIAVSFKKKYPSMFFAYRDMCEAGLLMPGDVFPFVDNNGLVVYNLITQGCVSGRIQLATLSAIEKSVSAMLTHAKFLKIGDENINIGIPKIGAGLGGLLWEDVENVLIQCLSKADSSINLIVHTL
jgi:O-acetyl-ADP-ribose deacetylase (regulator of RNase III)